MLKKHKPIKKIFWLTPDYFFDTDAIVVPSLMRYYQIEWMVVNTLNTKRNTDGLIAGKVRPLEFNLKHKQRDPRIIMQYFSLIRQIKRSNADLVYLSFSGLPYFFLLFFIFVRPEKVIYALHNVTTPKGAEKEWITRLFQTIYYSRIKRFHVFSKYQLAKIQLRLPQKTHYYAPLALKDFGTSGLTPPRNLIRFLYFGYILEYKRLDLLIKSFQSIYEAGTANIELFIAGPCDNWAFYQKMIKYNDVIKTRIEVVPNKDVPDLVSTCHYMVLPYQDGTQSGVIPLAYQYNKPVIVSDIEAFKQFIVDGYTGYVFKNKSEESLTETMQAVIRNHTDSYSVLQQNICQFKKEEYALEKIVSRYQKFLNECMK